MFQQMINGSIAVLSRPSVSTFEEHEKNDLGWALIYVVIAAVINAIIQAVTAPLRAAQVRQSLDAVTSSQLSDIGIDPGTIAAQAQAQAGGGNIIGSIIGALIGTIIVSLVYWGIVYGLGRAFGGTGQFGELAWDMSLYSAPMSIVAVLFGSLPIPFLGPIIGLAIALYNLYLTYLAIQSGLNLPSRQALYVILILVAIGLAIFACMCAVFGTLIAAIIGASQQ